MQGHFKFTYFSGPGLGSIWHHVGVSCWTLPLLALLGIAWTVSVKQRRLLHMPAVNDQSDLDKDKTQNYVFLKLEYRILSLRIMLVC